MPTAHRAGLAAMPFVLAACVTPPAIQPLPPQEYSFAAPANVVWQAIADVYADLGIPVDNMDRASGFIRGGPLPIYSRFADEPVNAYLDCGRESGSDLAQNKQIELRTTTLLQEQDGGSSVRTQVQARPMDRSEPCVSTGRLEQRITEAVTERLR